MRTASRTLFCPIDGEDLELIERMKAATGLPTDGNLVRTALYMFALHLQIDMASGAFGLRTERSNRRKSQSVDGRAREAQP